jgi:hypothetical protein
MGRAKNELAATARASVQTVLARRGDQDAFRAAVRHVVSEALGCPCLPGDDFGDYYDLWEPGPEQEVTLTVELAQDTMRITRISCSPEGRGLGTRVVNALRAHAAAHGMGLEVPDPFESSLPFWRRFDWTDKGDGDRIVLRSDPPGARP